MLAEQDLGISFANLNQFKIPKDLRGHPTTFFELETSLSSFGNLLGAVLGNQHPITAAYRPIWDSVQQEYKARLHHEIDIRRVIKPIHILRSIQLPVYNWFNTKKLRRMPPPPPFVDIWNASAFTYIPTQCSHPACTNSLRQNSLDFLPVHPPSPQMMRRSELGRQHLPLPPGCRLLPMQQGQHERYKRCNRGSVCP